MAIKKKVIGDELTVSKPKNVVESEGKLEGKSSAWQEFSKHIMTGISYMIPALIMGGLIGAFSQIIPYVFLGISPDVGIQDAMASGDFSGFHYHLLYLAWIMQSFGFTLFSFAIPIFAAFTANSIGGKAALISGFIGGYLAGKPLASLSFVEGKLEQVSKVPAGFLGALLIAFAMGYFVKWLNKNIKVSHNWMAFKTTFLVPLISALVAMILMIWVITPVGGMLNSAIRSGLEAAGQAGQGVYNIILAAATAFDLGGPVNKAAGFVALGFTTEKVLPITARCMAIVTPSFGLGLATLIDKKLVGRHVYDKQFYEAGKTAIFLGFMGISEGSIPFALEDPKFVIPLYVIGSIIGAMTGTLLGAVQWFPESAIWAWPLITNKIAYIIGLVVGSVFIAVINVYHRNKQIKQGKLEVIQD